MKLNIVQVIGLNTDQKAAQVIYSPRGEDNAFLAVLDLSCDDAFTRGRQILSELSDFYFDFEGTSAEKLKATYEEAKQKFSKKEETQQFSILVASVSGKILYLISCGEVEVYLKRAQKLSTLTSIGSESQLISGFLQPRDRLFLSTKSLSRFLGSDLEKSLNLPLEDFETEVSDRIGASDLENQGLAGLAVEVEPEEEQRLQELERSNIPKFQQQEYEQDGQTAFSSGNIRRNNPVVRLLTLASKLIKIISSNFPGSNRGRFIMAAILITIIALGVGYKVITSKNAKTEDEFNQSLQLARDDFNAAKGLTSLNPAEARSKLDSAKDKVNKALSLKPKSDEASDLKKQIDSESGSILQQVTLSDFPLFLDLDLVKKNFRAQSLSLSSGKLLLIDPAVGTLVAIDIAKKSNQILAGSEQLGEVKYASLNGGMAFVYSADKGILKVDSSNQKITTVSKTDKEWGQIKDIYGFASNIYLLDSGNPPAGGMIWKYLPTSDGYSDKREYLTSGVKADFSNALRMQIESSVYILQKSGEILRFTKGDKDNFSYSGLPSTVKDPKSFFVSSDTDNLYLLDSGNSRMLVLTKTGSYKSQISGSKFGEASDLAVDEKEKKVYLLDQGKIFQADLK